MFRMGDYSAVTNFFQFNQNVLGLKFVYCLRNPIIFKENLPFKNILNNFLCVFSSFYFWLTILLWFVNGGLIKMKKIVVLN